jgi:hypothetical protein
VAWRSPDDGVYLRWFDTSPHTAAYALLRRVGDGPWACIGRVSARDRSYVDQSAPRDELSRYRVCRAERHLDSTPAVGRWSNVALAPEARTWRARLDRWLWQMGLGPSPSPPLPLSLAASTDRHIGRERTAAIRNKLM